MSRFLKRSAKFGFLFNKVKIIYLFFLFIFNKSLIINVLYQKTSHNTLFGGSDAQIYEAKSYIENPQL